MTIHAVIASEPHLAVNLFDDLKPDELIQVTMKNGTSAIGTYLHVGRMHFIDTPDPNAPFGSRVIGPIKQQDIEDIVVLKDAAQVKLERFNRTRGDRLPGPEPKSREDFRFRLECLARAVIQEPASMRRYQLEKQFNDCADAINLAKAKRAWVFAETQWFLQHNRPPEMIDLWRSDIASPSLFKKPRDQDFDPDPVQRRKRVPYPADVSNDPLSVPNVLNKLKKLGCAAYISLPLRMCIRRPSFASTFRMCRDEAKSISRVPGLVTRPLGLWGSIVDAPVLAGGEKAGSKSTNFMSA